jgi:hypothetical protein
MNSFRSIRLLHAFGALLALACGAAPDPAEQRFDAELRVTSDDGNPLGGARFGTGKQELGTTSSAGTLSVRLRGNEGQALKLAVSCPEGYLQPTAVAPLRLTRTRRVGHEGFQSLAYDVTCARRTRSVALVVHAAGAGALPVLVDGKPQSSTDAEGNAHLLLELDRQDQQVHVKLDTAAHPELRPASPERTFDLGDQDALLLFEPELSQAPLKRRARAVSAQPSRHIPYRVD